MKPYPDNTKDWKPGDLVIHKAAAKKDWMLMCVVKVQKNGVIQTRYIMPGEIWSGHRRNVPFWGMPRDAQRRYGKIWKSPKASLLEPSDFDIEIPENFDRYWEVV